MIKNILFLISLFSIACAFANNTDWRYFDTKLTHSADTEKYYLEEADRQERFVYTHQKAQPMFDAKLMLPHDLPKEVPWKIIVDTAVLLSAVRDVSVVSFENCKGGLKRIGSAVRVCWK